MDSRKSNGNTIKPPEGLYMTVEAAKKVGCNPHTLRRWRKGNVFSPDKSMYAGKIFVPLYSDSDIARMKKLYQARKDHTHQFPVG